ncbi:hypothetical protein GQ54DRAFT_198838 [Martensiomyces pterosporus]|nr:hypothetical protein GQ54DRAFT_198838 [Martensiomyces pterosporus]
MCGPVRAAAWCFLPCCLLVPTALGIGSWHHPNNKKKRHTAKFQQTRLEHQCPHKRVVNKAKYAACILQCVDAKSEQHTAQPILFYYCCRLEANVVIAGALVCGIWSVQE